MKSISLDNDYQAQTAVTRRNTNTGDLEAAAGLAGLKFRLSLTDGGAAIHANLDIAATEYPSTPGTYYAIFQGDELRTRLATYVGTKIFEIFYDVGNVLTSTPRLVTDPRRV